MEKLSIKDLIDYIKKNWVIPANLLDKSKVEDYLLTLTPIQLLLLGQEIFTARRSEKNTSNKS